MNDIRSSLARQGLVRPRQGRILGGVCSGVGQRFGLTPWVSRLLFVLLLMVVPGSQVLIYPILWVLMPAEENVVYPTPDLTASGVSSS
ncbi:PspC domain-containing protein [Nocardioides lianchengensis]|uniref:Phage shock protein PspC (Stress-responsive transcriptional regulator) n=1 Tax=Nocardioides lianchengensis TaxID=1045774 RepID=A0A1G6VAU6_9ACTN|nr:PspC domain-containing protein [Nocardioides lianchengensis]NYG11193.1 phage shock protein PspC (stress-responsive transcriptional regulator) [Nocardioides lianchengensis]SDD50147.1 Phage shock protein PspC (stress-responsive transcriptional regulator) [Nocardioides lianchengensis]